MSLLRRLRLALMILVRRTPRHDPIFVHAVGALERVDRIAFLLAQARGRRVVHVGFLDTPFLERRLADRSLLHLALRDVTAALVGVDIAASDLERYRTQTGDDRNVLLDLSRPDVDLQSLLAVPCDIILFTEVLEHIGDPATTLRNLYRLCQVSGATLVITVPNAFAMHGFLAAADGQEIVHPDHVFYFSPVTLSRLVTTCGFTVETILQYGGSPRAWLPGLTDAGIICVCRA